MLFKTYKPYFPFYLFYNGRQTQILPKIYYTNNLTPKFKMTSNHPPKLMYNTPKTLYNNGAVDVEVSDYEICFSIAADGDAALKPYKNLNDAKLIISSDNAEAITKLYEDYDATGQIDFENAMPKDFLHSSYKVTLSLGQTEYDFTDNEFSIVWVNPYVALIDNISNNTYMIYSTKPLNEMMVLEFSNSDYMKIHFKPDILIDRDLDTDIYSNAHVITEMGFVRQNLRLLDNAVRKDKRIVRLSYVGPRFFSNEYIWGNESLIPNI